MDVSEEQHDAYIELCAAHALGSLDEADRERLERHLAAGCPECEAALADFSAGTVLLAASAPAAQPSARLKERVLAAVHAEETRAMQEATGRGTGQARDRRRPAKPPRRYVAAAFYGWAAAACLAAAVFLFARTTWRLRAEVDASREVIAGLEERLLQEETWARVVNSPSARVAVLTPTPAGNADLRARAMVDPATRRAVIVFAHFEAPSGRDYELWAIRGTAPTSLGVVKADASGTAIVRIEDIGDPATLNALAVSLEPAGGSPTPTAPTGPVVMLGALGG
jgi:anti-sigma-K factor RskA